MKPIRPVLAVLGFAAACGDSPSSPPEEEQETGLFALPIAGELNRDWYVTNYVDGQERSGLDDYQCGIKSYAGHRGTDLVLPDFERMDAGLDVVAAASGSTPVRSRRSTA